MRPLDVLVLGEEAEVAGEIADGLALDGVACHVAGSAAEALALVAKAAGAIGVVVTDIRLPGKDGHALAERLAGLPAERSVELVFVTGPAEPAEIGGAVLRRPFRWAEIKAVLGAAMRRAAARREELG
ncbi:response regulator [Falsiroseomonas sp. HW251]|uniref:response regulator n=1 Tax=Falsiroseomonas sp. HW251 TaxID=3390998 RepID=UPI003D3135D9